MGKRKQPIEKLETYYTVERWHEDGGYWDHQSIWFNRREALRLLRDWKAYNPQWNYRIRKTVETVVAEA